jgi:hypothetical protein
MGESVSAAHVGATELVAIPAAANLTKSRLLISLLPIPFCNGFMEFLSTSANILSSAALFNRDLSNRPFGMFRRFANLSTLPTEHKAAHH